MPQSVVIITSGQPSLNPRLVKEADALAITGYEVTVIYQYWNHWGTQADIALIKNKKWRAIRVGGSPDNEKLNYWLSRAKHIFYKNLFSRGIHSTSVAIGAIGRCAHLLIEETIKHKADLYIAHNLAALPAAVKAAKKNRAKCGFDAEDFHRYETTNDVTATDVKLKISIENKFIPFVNYVTAASPLIGEAYKQLYPALQPLVILNVFPKFFHSRKVNPSGQIKLFWYSQTIGEGRGLEDVLHVLRDFTPGSFELHLLGNHNTATVAFFNNLIGSNKKYVFFHQPIAPDKILDFAAAFDVGLAIETGVPKNRDICLTNKIFTYLQAGLAIIASETTAQKKFITTYENSGLSYPLSNRSSLKEVITAYLHDGTLLKLHQESAYKLGHDQLNWEIESKKFIEKVVKILN